MGISLAMNTGESMNADEEKDEKGAGLVQEQCMKKCVLGYC